MSSWTGISLKEVPRLKEKQILSLRPYVLHRDQMAIS